MTGLLVVAHAEMARELIKSAEMIMGGAIENAQAIAINPGDSGDDIHTAISAAVTQISADGAVIMTDMFGGTPSNISLSFLQENKVEVVTGVNLPMLIKFVSDRDRLGVAELAAALRDTGRDGITVAGDYLRK